MTKFGASSTFVWISAADDLTRMRPDMFPMESNGVLYLHTQQTKESYQLLIEYSYYFTHGKIKLADTGEGKKAAAELVPAGEQGKKA
jgi:hypothetical protein